MARETINIGTSTNDGTGDIIRLAFNKTNLNFVELYGKTGMFDYSNSETTPISISIPNTFYNLTNDTLGIYTQKAYAPQGINDIYNATTNEFDFSALSLGTVVFFRLDIDITTDGANNEFTLAFDMAIGGTNAYSINIASKNFKSSGNHNGEVFNGFFYIGSEDMRDNPAKLKIKSDNTGSALLKGIVLNLTLR